MYYSSIALFAAAFLPTVVSFTTVFPSAATLPECSPFEVTFQGPEVNLPLTLALIPVGSTVPQIIEIPDSAWNEASQSGQYSTLVPFASGTQFIAVMRDVDGMSNGGISRLHTVQSSSDSSCTVPQPSTASWFTLDPSPPVQCQMQAISWAAPFRIFGQDQSLFSSMNITGYVPGGTAFGMSWSPEADMYSQSGALWNVNVPEGQDYLMLFETVDAVTGEIRRETSALQTVTASPSGDDACLIGGPSVTPQTNTPTSTSASARSTSSPSSSQQQVANTNSASVIGAESDNEPVKFSSGAIIGAIFGVLIFFGTVGALVFFYLRRRKARATREALGSSDLENDAASTYSRDSTTPMISEKKGPFYNSTAPSRPPAAESKTLPSLALPPFRHSAGFNLTYESPSSSIPSATIFHHDSRPVSPVASKKGFSSPLGVSGRSMSNEDTRVLSTPPRTVPPKKSILDRTKSSFKSRKEAAFSIGSWGNKGRLSALDDSEVPEVPQPMSARLPPRPITFDPFAAHPVNPSSPPSTSRQMPPFPTQPVRSRSLDSNIDDTTSPSSEGSHVLPYMRIGEGWPAPPLPGSRPLIPTPKLHVVNAAASDYSASEAGYSEIYGAIAPGLPGSNIRPALVRVDSTKTAKSSGTNASAFQGVAL